MKLEVIELDVKDGFGMVCIATFPNDARRIREFFDWAMKTDEKLDATIETMNNIKMERCQTCRFRHANGYCTSPKITEDCGHSEEESRDMLLHTYHEGGYFWVGPDFGCVHHEKGTE